MRGIASLIVTLCLLAAGSVRAQGPIGREDAAPQLVAANHALVASLAPRRDAGGRDLGRDLRLAPFTIPASAHDLPAVRTVAAGSDRIPPWVLDARVPARSSRGPPCG
jgi:hypothetical protein